MVGNTCTTARQPLVVNMLAPSSYSTHVVVASPHSTVLDVCIKMKQSRISAVVLTTERRVVGIFTERDVVRLVGKAQDCASVLVSEVMTRNPVCVTGECGNLKAMETMCRGRFRHLPVVTSLECRELVGMYDCLSLGYALFHSGPKVRAVQGCTCALLLRLAPPLLCTVPFTWLVIGDGCVSLQMVVEHACPATTRAQFLFLSGSCVGR